MSVVVTNVSAIRTGSGEISQAADDLSRRTEQQAASLEETAAALDEIYRGSKAARRRRVLLSRVAESGAARACSVDGGATLLRAPAAR